MALINRSIDILKFFFHFKKDIEIFGMYHGTNLGDEAMKIAALATVPRNRAVGVISDSRFSVFNILKRKRKRKELMVGGGTLIHGGNQKGENRWLDYVELRFKQGSRVSVFGTGIAFNQSQIECKSKAFQRWARILKRASEVEVRGPLSQQIAYTMGVKASIFGDFVFSLFNPLIIKKRKTVIHSDRILGFNIGECLGKQEEYENFCVHVVREVSKDFFIKFFIVTPKDIRATVNVIHKSEITTESYEVINIYQDPYKFMSKIINCSAFIGLKLHASGLAMTAGIPTLLFEYLPKCRDFVLPIGLERSLLEFPLNKRNIETKIEDLFNNPSKYVNINSIKEICDYQKKKIKLRYS